MTLILFTQIFAALALVFTLAAFGWRLRLFNALARPVDRSTPKGNPRLGILIVSPWLYLLPVAWRTLLALGAALGALLGLAGFITRFAEHNLKALSTPDDYTAVLVVSLFQASAGLWLVFAPALPLFYLVSAVMLVYAPFSKIRHCIYYAYSRLFFGKFVGSRAVLPHSQQGAR